MLNDTADKRPVNVLGVRYHNITNDEAVEQMVALLAEGSAGSAFYFNIDCLRQAREDAEYHKILDDASFVLSDGIGLRILTRLCGERMRDNCEGTDLFPRLVSELPAHGYSIFLLGGKPGVAEQAADTLCRRCPGLRVAGALDGYFQNEEAVIARINQSGADVLFVAMGVPKQEKWIARNRSRLKPRLCVGVGALLDYLSGNVQRAPGWMMRSNIEWLWRVFIDPKRMVKRYLIDDIVFLISAPFRIGFGRASTVHRPGQANPTPATIRRP
jgi:N-acetylglucosaminyldiphosphoundecaprenol N-acetyl-beta-D-mannosaminyltransferase